MNYNVTLHFKLTTFHLTKMAVTHVTVEYLFTELINKGAKEVSPH